MLLDGLIGIGATMLGMIIILSIIGLFTLLPDTVKGAVLALFAAAVIGSFLYGLFAPASPPYSTESYYEQQHLQDRGTPGGN